jgi:hypothetical protein
MEFAIKLLKTSRMSSWKMHLHKGGIGFAAMNTIAMMG